MDSLQGKPLSDGAAPLEHGALTRLDVDSDSSSSSSSSSSSLGGSASNDGASACASVSDSAIVSSGGASYWASRGGSSATLSSDASDGAATTGGAGPGAWPVDREDHECTTSDGVTLRLVRGVCPAASTSSPREHPVILVPGLASSAGATWDVAPRLSLFEHLARQGYDVWLVDLRGNGRSGAPHVPPLAAGWCVDDHLLLDLPAAVGLIRSVTGAQQLHWIGHSMGGMLATGALSMQTELAGTIRSIAMVGSGCYGAGSWYSLLKPLVLAICLFGFPGDVAGATIGRLAGTWASLAVAEAMFYWRSNTEVEAARKLMRTCFRFIPRGLIFQFLDSIATPKGLATADGRLLYCDPAVLRCVPTPVLGLTGDWDLFCPPAGGRKTVQAFGGGGTRRFVELGPKHGTSKNHYGHFDVIMGRNAPRESWPYVTAFLEEHDAPTVIGIADGAAPPGASGGDEAAGEPGTAAAAAGT